MCVPRKNEPLQPTQSTPGRVDVVDGTTFKKHFSAGLGLGTGVELGRTASHTAVKAVKSLPIIPKGVKKLM